MSFSLENICRTCMHSAAADEDDDNNKEYDAVNRGVKAKNSQMVLLHSIHKDIQDNVKLVDILRATVPQLRIEANDKLPKKICLQCVTKVKELHKFQQNCLKVEQQLYKMFDTKNDKGQLSSADIKVSSDCDISVNSEMDDDVFIDENSFEEFIDEDDTKDEDCLEALSDMDDFIESCSDMSIDFVLDDDSDSHSDQAIHSKTNTAAKGVSSEQEMLPCDRCGRILKSQMSLKKHIKKMHNKRDGVELKCVCNICDRAFSQAYMLRDHLRSHSGEKPFLCSECGKGFTSSSGLKLHLLRHQSEQQYTCPDCPLTFPTRIDLASHCDVHKARPKIHICDVCGRGFPKAFTLKKHKMSHTTVRPFPCEFCEKRFLTNEKLQRHTRIHTGEKPYKCKYCDRAYCQSNELTKHLRCHLGENVYQCRFCPERYPTAKMVKEHFKVHKHEDEQTRAQHLADLNAMEVKGIFCR